MKEKFFSEERARLSTIYGTALSKNLMTSSSRLIIAGLRRQTAFAVKIYCWRPFYCLYQTLRQSSLDYTTLLLSFQAL